MIDLTTCSCVLVFGGTFDPPHAAHVELPRLAMKKINADAVAYVPAAVSPFKTAQRVTDAAHRLAMLRLALADQPHAVILTDELERGAAGEPSYTVNTLEALARRLGGKTTLRLLLGADQLRSFDRWRSPERIVKLAPLVVTRRGGTTDDLEPLLRRWSATAVEAPVMDVSATDIRRRVGSGESIEGLVHPEVARYIREHGLYGG